MECWRLLKLVMGLHSQSSSCECNVGGKNKHISCGYKACEKCWIESIKNQIIEKPGSPYKIKCLNKDCEDYINPNDEVNKLTNNEKEIQKTIENILETIPDHPTKLEDFGYDYNEHGELRKISDGSKFTFITQNHYNVFGDYVLNHIQTLMKQKYNFEEIWIPNENPSLENPSCNIFLSPNAQKSKKLALIIQGSGAVR